LLKTSWIDLRFGVVCCSGPSQIAREVELLKTCGEAEAVVVAVSAVGILSAGGTETEGLNRRTLFSDKERLKMLLSDTATDACPASSISLHIAAHREGLCTSFTIRIDKISSADGVRVGVEDLQTALKSNTTPLKTDLRIAILCDLTDLSIVATCLTLSATIYIRLSSI